MVERLEFLGRSNLPFARTFEPLLDAAPRAELATMLTAIPQQRPGAAENRWSRRRFLRASAPCLIAGIALSGQP